MRLYVGITDSKWFEMLSTMEPAVDEVNFWKPSLFNGKRLGDGFAAQTQ